MLQFSRRWLGAAERRAVAWYSGGRINLDKIESVLGDLKVGTVRVASHAGPAPQPSAFPGWRQADALLFTLIPGASIDASQQNHPSVQSLLKDLNRKKTFVLLAEGSIVGWNASWQDILALWSAGCSAPTAPSNTLTEAVKYTVADPEVRASFDNDEDAIELNTIDADTDTLVLADDESDHHKLPFSYAMSQSVKMDVLDDALTPVQENLKTWQKGLGQTGAIGCSVRDLRQTKTQLLTLFEELKFTHSVQTTPRIFWNVKYQRHRPVYKLAREHLEIDDRYEQLLGKILAIDESLNYLHSEVHSSTNEVLTWVIIGLIVIEIILALPNPVKFLHRFKSATA